MLLTAKPGINLVMSYIIQSIQKLLILLGLLLRLTLAHVLQQGSIVDHSSDLTKILATTFFAACVLFQPKLASFYMTKANTLRHTCVHATCLRVSSVQIIGLCGGRAAFCV